MSRDQRTRPEDEYSEQEAKRILARAAEIDATTALRFSTSDLHRIAADASIAPAALERALSETAEPSPETRPSQEPKRETSSVLAKALGYLGIGAALGALAATVDGVLVGPELAAAVFGPSAAFVLYRALRNRWHGSLPDFLREVTLIMGSFTMSATAVEGFHATTPTLIWSVICLAAGSAVVGIDFRVKPDRFPKASEEASDAAVIN